MWTQAQLERAQRIRSAQDAIIPAVADNPVAVNGAVALIREWAPGTAANPVTWTKDRDVRQRNSIPYKCNQTHMHHGEPGWGPGENDALWSEYHGTSPETARPYKQPLGAHDAYRVDEYAIEGGAVFRCKADNTVYPPSSLPGSWEAVGGGTEPEPEPVDEWPAWVQPAGSHDAYIQGAKVSHKGNRWTSNAGGNVWEPGVYGWTEVT